VTTTPHASAEDVFVGTADGSLHRIDARNGTVLSARKLDASLTPTSVLFRTANSLLILLTDQAADYRALVPVDLALQDVQWQVTADMNWSTSRVFVWGDVIVLGTASGDVVVLQRDLCAVLGAVCQGTRSLGRRSRTHAVGGDQDWRTLHIDGAPHLRCEVKFGRLVMTAGTFWLTVLDNFTSPHLALSCTIPAQPATGPAHRSYENRGVGNCMGETER
jgi:hypothetical protein